MNCISSSDNTAPLRPASDTFVAMMMKAPLHPADRVRSTTISVERHALSSLFEDLSREMDEFDDDDDSIYDSDIDESEHALIEEGESDDDFSFGVFAMMKAPLHSADRLQSTNVSVERHCLSSLFADLLREDFDEYDDDDNDSILSDVSDFEFEQQQQADEAGECDIMPSSDVNARAAVALELQEDKHRQDEDENLSLPSSSRLIILSSARSSSNNDGDDHISNDDNKSKSRSAAQRSSNVQDDIMATLRELTRDLREKMDCNADDDTGEGNDMPVVSKKSHQCGAAPSKKDADNKRPGPVVTEEKTTRDGTTMMMTLAAKAVELSSSSSPPPRHYWATTPRRRSPFPRRWLEEDRACIRR